MLNLSIDMSNFIDESVLSESEIDGFKALLLDSLADGFKDKWQDEINSTLHSTRREYEKGAFIDRPDDNTIVMGVIATKSQLAVDLETGKNAFDEKIGFSMSPKRHDKKDGGWFLTIPFRSAIPTAVGESSAFTNVMPLSVYLLARKANKPLTLAQLPTDQQVKGVRAGFNSGGVSYPAYRHKSARYEGLFRFVDTDENRGTYFTFRRVSDLSDKNSWIHPGFLPFNLIGKAMEKVDIGNIVRTAKIDFFGNNLQ
jgi:hypothetical protein